MTATTTSYDITWHEGIIRDGTTALVESRTETELAECLLRHLVYSSSTSEEHTMRLAAAARSRHRELFDLRISARAVRRRHPAG